MSGNFVFVAREEGGEPFKIPLGEDGTVSFSTLRSIYPRVIGLVYRIEDDNFTSVVPVNESGFHPPQDGWGQRIYWCIIFSEGDRINKRKCDATTSVSSVAKAKKNNRQEITPETLTDVIDQIDRLEAATPTMSNSQHEREAHYTSSPTMTYVTALSRIGFNWERIFFKLGLALFTVISAVVLHAVNFINLEKHITTFNTFVTMFACVGSCLCGLDIVYLNRGRIKERVANRWRKFRGVNGEQSATHE